MREWIESTLASIILQHVSRRYGTSFAVRDLSLEIADQEFLVLVGPSGCGKSTALRLIAGLDTLTSGDIFIDGRAVTHVPPKERDVAMVFQNYALYPHMTVYDNLAFGLHRHISKKEVAPRIHDIAASLGLESLLARKPKQLSGGQRQRVALGRALLRDPKVCLMDEPLSHLDARLRVEMRTYLSALHQRYQTTTLYVTHDHIEAMTLGTRIAVMRDGVVEQLAAPQEIYAHPATMFVASFIGTPTMNFFPASLVRHEGALYADTTYFRLPLSENFQRQHPHVSELVVGIRSEDIYERAFMPEELQGIALTVTIDLIEHVGSDLYTHFLLGSQRYVARLDRRSLVTQGATCDLVINMQRCHIFDRYSERCLSNERF